MNYLNVSFAEKDQAKSLGARWNGERWYVPEGVNLEPFARWLPKGTVIESRPESPDQKGEALSVFLRKASLALKNALPTAQWVRAEISQYQTLNGGHISINLVEHNEAGQLSARIQAFIWTSHAKRVVEQFTAGTGGPLTVGLKVMVKASIDMHLTNNMRLVITDIDPSYTLGDIEANLKKIRSTLTQEGVIDANKNRERPTEFCRVAIISPESAAGLGDFKRDADVLENHGLCHFDYFSALFQGQGASASILSALQQVQDRHPDAQYDALCIIRGGGAATDLYWLNDLALARAICLMPIPVFTGIGHERDNTVLDELANVRFDTPSKVIASIRSTIQSNALAAEKDFQSVLLYAQRLATSAEKEIESLFTGIQQDAVSATHLMSNKIDQLYASIAPNARQWLYKAEQDNEQRFQFIRMRCESDLAQVSAEIDRHYEFISVDVLHKLGNYDKAIERYLLSIQQYAGMQIDNAVREIEWLGREILGMGPRATLNRGFAMARSLEGQPIVSADQARHCQSFTVEFRDGVVGVKIGGSN